MASCSFDGGIGRPSNNLDEQLRMLKQVRNSTEKAKGKDGLQVPGKSQAIFKFFTKARSSGDVPDCASTVGGQLNGLPAVKNDNAKKCLETSKPSPAMNKSVGSPASSTLRRNMNETWQDEDTDDDFEVDSRSPLSKKRKIPGNRAVIASIDGEGGTGDTSDEHEVGYDDGLVVDLTEGCSDTEEETSSRPEQQQELAPFDDECNEMFGDEVNWSFGFGTDQDDVLDVPINAGNPSDDGVFDDNEVPPDSPGMPDDLYISPTASPQPQTSPQLQADAQGVEPSSCDINDNRSDCRDTERDIATTTFSPWKNKGNGTDTACHLQPSSKTPTIQLRNELQAVQKRLWLLENERNNLQSKANHLKAMLSQRGEPCSYTPDLSGGQQPLFSSTAVSACSTPLSTSGSNYEMAPPITSPPCGDSFYANSPSITVNHTKSSRSSTRTSNCTSEIMFCSNTFMPPNENTAPNYSYHNSGPGMLSSSNICPTTNASRDACDVLVESEDDDWVMMSITDQPNTSTVTNVSNREQGYQRPTPSLNTASTFGGCSGLPNTSGSRSFASGASTGRVNSSFGKSPRKPNLMPNDGDDAQLNRTDYPFSKDMWKILRDVFHIKSLRTNQLQVINAAMQKLNCFVLMPTGGGKSLCYQVTALMGKGVTFVISPLKSLIQDQVQRLNSLRVPATHLSGDVTSSEAMKHVNSVYQDLSLRQPHLKLVYVTPEKLSASNKLNSVLSSLYSRGLLDRFVIDEAHCISQWGHDFRPDYKKLSDVKNKFPGVPIMGLTATATPRVRKDIENQLRMSGSNCKRFTQSFDRPNLQFQVKPKKKAITEEIIELVKSKYPHSSGIVYCLSRNECERVAKTLQGSGIRALAYHAGLGDEQRVKTQETWIQGRVKVVCATIAFGMGIDKGDVRYVIHYSMPKSLEGYYQECGRAGRDGKKAECILYYTYGDMHRIRRMIEGDQPGTKVVHMDNLYRVVQFSENQTECRRVQILHYFGETNYDKSRCQANQETVCDNCRSSMDYVNKDITDEARAFVETVNTVVHRGNRNWQNPRNVKFTLNHFVDVFKGSNNVKVNQAGHEKCVLFGFGKDYHRNDAERLARMLVMKDVLHEKMVIGNHDNVICYAVLGSKAMPFINGRFQLPTFPVRREKAKTVTKTKRKKKGAVSENSTNEDMGSFGQEAMLDSDGIQSRYWRDDGSNSAPPGVKRKRKTAGQKTARSRASDNDCSGYSSGGMALGVQKSKYNKRKPGSTKRVASTSAMYSGPRPGLGLMAPPKPVNRFK